MFPNGNRVSKIYKTANVLLESNYSSRLVTWVQNVHVEGNTQLFSNVSK